MKIEELKIISINILLKLVRNFQVRFPPSNKNFADYLKPAERKCISQDDILTVLSNLKSNKSSGLDEISPKLLKDSRRVITLTLTLIFNQSLIP